ncbi:hypothetical protein PF005_g26067 [Phytophthora fragariae]|uniref:Uncharacterized protein n=1 Tax=Phytophthora fragariae TaxID=53985 RepID=A0A6A3DU45_9STRA|nr:hypothetical protein PF009_g25207 [Phytophthora fragariae]KAE8975768.1 hypothetical protein PF011_g24336 [Phytophthora fragariae]KAE9071513.1 hypothetical protein PF007_g26527 [Phytophthora fragariae]KAE9072077.1 hypothetical protein PF010_g25631 [Phytophthora fragariae]KAE9092813.1 hypothetical protein PF006_g24596 [Phytophthora fragariae]
MVNNGLPPVETRRIRLHGAALIRHAPRRDRRESRLVTLLLATYDGKVIDLVSMKFFKQRQIALHVAAKYANCDGSHTHRILEEA